MSRSYCGVVPGFPRPWALKLTLGWVVLACGCNDRARHSSRMTQSHQIGSGVTLEVEGTYATYGRLDRHLSVVVWSDLPARQSRSGTEDSAVEFQGSHGQPGQGEIRWIARVYDSQEGSVQINGTELNLEQGQLILASYRNGRPVIQQRDYKIQELDADDIIDCLRGWITSEEEIRQFFSDE